MSFTNCVSFGRSCMILIIASILNTCRSPKDGMQGTDAANQDSAGPGAKSRCEATIPCMNLLRLRRGVVPRHRQPLARGYKTRWPPVAVLRSNGHVHPSPPGLESHIEAPPP